MATNRPLLPKLALEFGSRKGSERYGAGETPDLSVRIRGELIGSGSQGYLFISTLPEKAFSRVVPNYRI